MTDYQILDRATAPTDALQIAQDNSVGWAIYIGGPGMSPAEIDTWAAVAPELSVVPRLWVYGGGQTDWSQLAGEVEAADAVIRCASRFEIPKGATIFLDVEAGPARQDLAGVIAKVEGWVSTIRSAGYRAGVYSAPDILTALATANPVPDAVWVGSWIVHGIDDSLSAANVTGLESGLWDGPGQRAWQYAGAFADVPCIIDGIGVDVSVAQEGVLTLAHLDTVATPEAPSTPPAAPSQTATVAEPAPEPAAPTTYVVQPGDTLSGIAAKLHLSSWQQLYTANVATIEAAAHGRGFADSGGGHLIFPGTVLRIP